MSYYRVSGFLILFLLAITLISCRQKPTLFQSISSFESGINFRNDIVENDSVNQLDIENVYNGGGSGIGDFNRDGLPDIFLTGNVVPSRLYLNNSDFRFTDITEEAGINTSGKWCRGVAVTDINSDGWPDIYLSVTLKKNPEERRNLLYVNQGLNSNNIPVFKEEAQSYGLDDDGHTTQAVFFDYDRDGDLDVYLVANEINEKYSPYLFRPVIRNGRNPSTGKLYRNNLSDTLKHPVFEDVSAQAGIQTEGYGHSASVTDINNDGWPDIYVGNDFFTNDLLWINNGNGTFTDKLASSFKHTSANTMGNDVGDINNDGLQDLVTLDMNPEDNYRKKMMLPASAYQQYQYTERYGYSYQYVRNSLQLNMGVPYTNDSTGLPIFSDIGYLAGITATDWSWTPMLTDFDNDGYRDLIICNGFPKDITDHDFAMFRTKAYKVATKNEILSQVPVVKLHNYAFRNNGDLTFSDVSETWGMTTPTFSNGAAYADFDRDGDLDIIMNNINDVASLYRNNTRENYPEESNYLTVRLIGESNNKDGIGSVITIHYNNGEKQIWENNPFRGYLSTIEPAAHFGLGNITLIDSLVIRWNNGKIQISRHIDVNKTIILNISEASVKYESSDKHAAEKTLFSDVTKESGIKYIHGETDFVDFNIQKLLPHKFSEYGPSVSKGDIDGNGLEDIVLGGSANNSAAYFLQQKDGSFIEKNLISDSALKSKTWDDTGVLLFDADNDNDPDLYIASGGYENENNTSSYQDHFYINMGNGIFVEAPDAVPVNYTSKSCVRGSDYDRDGDTDIFIAGWVDPWHYPRPVSGILLRNDSSPGKIKFKDVTSEAANELLNIGMICDALFSDFDNDGWQDLVLAGEWMPVTILKNYNGTFKNITAVSGLSTDTGWWNSITSGDFDKDGDPDYILGNLGLNSFYKASDKYPVSVYAADFDNNGSYDAFTSIFLPSSQENRTLREFPANGRDDAVKQMIGLRSKFQNYRSFANATIDQLFSPEQLNKSLVLRAYQFNSTFCRNDGNGKFSLIPLPVEAQFSRLKGMVSEDFNGDGNPDIAVIGNDWGTEVLTGRYDAFNGLILLGYGNGNFKPLTLVESGFFVPGNGRGIVSLRNSSGTLLLAVSQNRGPLKIFELNLLKK